MARKYFTKFPTITYNGFKVRDLTVAAKVVDRFTNLPYVYDSFEVNRDERPDTVANDYYGDPYMSWVVFYANKTVDPYYGWSLSETDFSNHVQVVSGSLERAQKRVVEFRHNWYNDDRKLTTSAFNAMFSEYSDPHSKYWDPVYSEETDKLLYYERKVSEAAVNTNKIVRVQVSNNSPSKLSVNDLVDIKTPDLSTVIATAEVVGANTTSVTFKNVLGQQIYAGCVLALDGSSNAYCTISNYSHLEDFTSPVWTITNIPDEEYVYWAPITEFDVARQKNEELKNVKLIDPISAKVIADKLEEELRSD